MRYILILFILFSSIIFASCIKNPEKSSCSQTLVGSISEKNNVFPNDEIDFSKIVISNDSLDLALFNLLVDNNLYSEEKILANINVLIDRGANPNAVVEYKYSVRKLGTYIPIVKSFYKKKYRTYSNNSTPFIEAVNTRNLKIVNKMISLGADVNTPSRNKIFPIDIALKNENLNMINLLVENKCNIKNANLSECKDIELIEKMVNLGTSTKTININFALENEADLKRILLLKPNINNAELNFRTIFNNEQTLNFLLEAGLNNTAKGKFPDNKPLIFNAIKYSDLKTIKKLETYGIDIFYKIKEANVNNTPLFAVIKSQKKDILEYYIQKGANVNEKDWTKRSALISAVNTDNDIIIKLLLDAGANKEYKGYFNKTPLMYAVDYDHYISAQTLINEDANLNYKNKYGETCLSIAIKRHNLPMIKLLKENGANFKIKYKNLSIQQYAESINSPNIIVQYLKDNSK